MNFNEFYNKTKESLTNTVTSLWAPGDVEYQKYFKYILEKEPLLAEPVFQNTFPWEPAGERFGELNNIFRQEFIDSLDGINNTDFKFPKDRKPYKHQIESWKTLLKEKKSIVVTTGTGSGKTECFMLPVLHDIYENSRNQTGINAIFLYPLNALIGSQKKRIHAWTEAIGGVNYGVYNRKNKRKSPTSTL